MGGDITPERLALAGEFRIRMLALAIEVPFHDPRVIYAWIDYHAAAIERGFADFDPATDTLTSTESGSVASGPQKMRITKDGIQKLIGNIP